MNSKIVFGIAVAVLFVSFLTGIYKAEAGNAGTEVYVDPQVSTAAVGSTLIIDVILEDVPDLYGWEAKLFWDNTILECTAEEYPILPPDLNWEAPNNLLLGWPGIEQNFNETHGRWYHGLSALPMSPPMPVPFTGTIKLVTLTFEVKAAGSCTLTLIDVALRGRDTTTLTQYPRWSDVNADGVVDIFDVVDVLKVFGSEPGDPNWNQKADFDDDGKVDITDVVIVASDFGKSFGDPLWGVTFTVYDIPATLQSGNVIAYAPVGGIWVPINTFELLAPWIGLVSLITVTAISIVYVTRRKKKQT